MNPKEGVLAQRNTVSRSAGVEVISLQTMSLKLCLNASGTERKTCFLGVKIDAPLNAEINANFYNSI